MGNNSRIILVNVVLLILLVGGGFLGYYYYSQSVNYLSTDNARVDGQQMMIGSPTAGVLSNWTADVGTKCTAGGQIGTVQSAAGSTSITCPQAGTIVQQNTVTGALVSPGIPLAYAYDLDRLWVTANIDETHVSDISTGQQADIYVDAYPGTTFSGKVGKVGLATAGTFSLLPASNNTGNYTKVTQVVPVRITFDGNRGLNLLPGMNVSVRIHR
jgi:multidrug resistance efflux pump